MLALVLVALSLGLSNFAAAAGIGVSGVNARTRLEVGVVFGLLEAGMPLLGLALGHQLAHNLGHETRWVGGGLLVATGAYGLLAGLRGRGRLALPTTRRRTGRLVLTGLALGVDNLAVGLALGARWVPASALVPATGVRSSARSSWSRSVWRLQVVWSDPAPARRGSSGT